MSEDWTIEDVENSERYLYWGIISTFIQADTGKGEQLYAVKIASAWTESLNRDLWNIMW
jgi:hypothetical protein